MFGIWDKTCECWVTAEVLPCAPLYLTEEPLGKAILAYRTRTDAEKAALFYYGGILRLFEVRSLC